MNAGNGQRPNQHVGRVQQQIPTNPNLCQFQYVGMPLHHQALKNTQFSPTQGRNHGYMGPQQSVGAQPGQATFPVASMANMASPLVAGNFPTADIANINQMGPPRPAMQYKNVNNWPNPNPQNNMALPSFGSLWSHFQQQQHNKQNIQQQPQHVNQQVAYLPSQPQQQQFISNPDGITFCGSPNLQYGMNQSSGTINQAINYGQFVNVINRIPQAGQNPQILNACPSSIGLGHHQGMIPTLTANTGLLHSTVAQTALAKAASVAASSNQITTPTTTVTLTCSTSAHVTETATVHSRIPVSSVLSFTSNTVKPQSVESNTLCKDNNHTDITSIKIPFGWKRLIDNSQVVYFSPSSVKLSCKQEVCNYLLLDETCKCGLECPLLVDKVFNFDLCVVGQPWSVEDVTCSQDLSKLCNHSRKMIALAKFQHSQAMSSSATVRSESCSSQGDERDHSDVENTKTDLSPHFETKPKVPNPLVPNHISSTHHKTFGTPLLDTCTQAIIPPTIMVHNHRMPKFQDVPRMNPFDIATKPKPVRKRKPRAKKSQTPDPAADLGPITCHVPQKLDFSQESHFSYRFKVDQMNCHMQPSLSPNDYQQGLVSPQGLLSPQGLVSPSNVFNAQSQGMKGPVVFQNSPSVCSVPSGHFLEQVPTSALNPPNLQSQFQLPVNIQSNTGVMFQQMMPVHNPASPRLGNDAMYNQNQNNPYQPNVLCNSNTSGYVYPQMNDLMWLEAGKPKSKRPRGKKDKHKLNSIVDRTSPCPNVDVRHLGQKTPDATSEVSFLENPTAFLAQQTVLVNNSIKSPLTQSKDLNLCNLKPGDGVGFHNTSALSRKLSSKPQTTTALNIMSASPGGNSSNTLQATITCPTSLHNKQLHSPDTNQDILGETNPDRSHDGQGDSSQDKSDKEDGETQQDMSSSSPATSEVDFGKGLYSQTDTSPSHLAQVDGHQVGPMENDQENHTVNNPHQITVSTEQNDFPASNLLSAAARAQLTQQQTQNIMPQNSNTITNTVTDNSNVSEWMNKVVLPNNGTTNIPLDQHIHIMLQQNPNFLAGSSGGLVNTFNGMTGLPLNMFFPLGQTVDPSSISPSNFLVNVNQQFPLMKSDASSTSTVLTVSQDPNTLKTSMANIQTPNHIQTAEMVTTDQGMAPVNAPMPRISVPLVSNVTNSISQVIPTVGVTQPIINQQPLTAQMLGGMTFPAMNNLFVANTIAPNQTCNPNLTLMDIVHSTDQTKGIPKTSPTSMDNIGITGNISAPINQDVLTQATKNDQLGNSGNQQLLFLPNLNVPMMQVLGSNPYVQQGDLEKLGLQSTPQYMVPSPMVDPNGQFCANQQNQAGILGLLGMQQMWNNISTTGIGNLTPAQLQQAQLQQLLFQQLQGMQTLINLQTLSQQGLDNSGQQQSQGLKMEQDGVDGGEALADPEGGQCDETEEVVKQSPENKKIEKPRKNVNKSYTKNMNKKHSSANTSSESNHVGNVSQAEKFSTCVPRKKIKQETGVNHVEYSTTAQSHLPGSNCVNIASQCRTNHTSENHITSGCAKTEYVNHSDHKPIQHYNGEITVVNTSSLKRSREDELDDKGNLMETDIKLFPHKNFSLGDLVWGEIAGSDWPGKLIHSRNHINTEGSHTNGEEKVLVKWFGNCGESKVDLFRLKSWSEGLLAYQQAQQTQQTKNKRERHFNATLEEAIKEALLQEPANELPLMVRANKKKKV